MNSRNSRQALLTAQRFIIEKSVHSDPNLETDPSTIHAWVKFIEQIFTDVVVVICARERVNYVSANCQDILGYQASHFRSLTLEDTLTLLHEDDVKAFSCCMDKMMKITSGQYASFKYLLTYRLRNPNGGYRLIEDQKIAIDTSHGKFLFVTLLRDISGEGSFQGVKLIIQKKVKNSFTTIHEYVPDTDVKFAVSHRQLEIISLVARGLSNKAIADRLHLSINTVKNHKQMLFKKLNAKNNIEMLNAYQTVATTDGDL